MHLNRVKHLLLAVLAVCALGAAAAGAAQAAGGPEWITANGVLPKTTTSKNVSSVFKLKTTIALLTIECKKETDTGELIGGNPGTDTSTVTFEECAVAGKTVTTCGAATAGKGAGIVGPFKVKTLLGYPKGKAPNKEEAYDQFFPTPSKTEFTSFELTGTACGSLKEDKVKVVATGTEVPVTTGPKCGVIAKVGKIVAGAFVGTKSGETATAGGLDFPEPAITEEEVWNGTAFEVVKCGLKAETSSGNATAEEVGVALVETVPAEAFGWKE